MSALAQLLRERGFRVRGSDCTKSEITEHLERVGIHVDIGENQVIYEDTVVYSGAISAEHPQLKAAKKQNKRIFSRPQLLQIVAERFAHVIAVSGCHGKTTCTAMLAHIFAAANLPFTCHIGGEDVTFGNYADYGDEFFITEACEYQKSFLSLKAECAVVLNIDRDHMDCYLNEQELISTFATFSSSAKHAVVNAEDGKSASLPRTRTFGLVLGDYRALDLATNGEKYSFTVLEREHFLTRVELNVYGKVYVYNALAAIAAARLYQISPEFIRKGLKRFRGVKRRFEEVGTLQGTPVICDYAHHPREIRYAVQTAQKICKGTVKVVFQPHTYSRTKDLMFEFVEIFQELDAPIIYQTYPAREQFDAEGSAVSLVSRIPEAIYVQSKEQLKTRLYGALSKDDMILVLGAGDVYSTVKQILD